VQIEKEKERVLLELENFNEYLLDSIKKRKYVTPHIRKFEELIEHIYITLKSQLPEHLEEITSYGSSEEKSLRIEELYSKVKCLFDFMYRTLLHSSDVPRELYYLSDIFLDFCNVPKDYIIFVSDDIAMLSYHDVLRACGFDPEFWGKLYGKEFYFVLILPEFSKRDASIDWTIILHEMAHIICDKKGANERYLPFISVSDALLIVRDADRQIYPDQLILLAKKKLYVNEHLADLLVTQCFGAIYGWRFLERFFSIRNVFEPGKSHPSPSKRLQKISHEIKNKLKMRSSAKFLDCALHSLLEEIESPSGTVNQEVNVDDILESILDEVYGYSQFTLTFKQVKLCLLKSSWFQVVKRNKSYESLNKNIKNLLRELQNQLLKGIPIIVCPPVLYFILTLDFSNITKIKELDNPAKEEAKLIKEMIADCIRLYAVQQRFLREVLP